jgi:hypothetical protein
MKSHQTAEWSMEKLWPEACNNSVEVQEEMVIQNFVELASEVRLDSVNKDEVEELLQSHGKSYL